MATKKSKKYEARPAGVDRPISDEKSHASGSRSFKRKVEGTAEADEERVDDKAERKDTGSHNIHRINELAEEDVVIGNEDVLPTGIQTGQTTRGSYSTDTATGAGRYGDHRAGTFGVAPVAQPGNDEEVEPDPLDPKVDR